MDVPIFNVNYSSQLTTDIINYLNSSLSKFSIDILRELYQTPHMQQKKLAANLHTSATSLSNIISRLEEIQPQLLISERIGRSKYYSLTEIANLYVAQIIMPQTTSKIHRFSTLSQENTLLSDALNAFYHFQETAGKDWDIIFDNLLYRLNTENQENLTFSAPNELFTLILNFLYHVKKMKALNQTSQLHEIYDILGQSILIKRLEIYLSTMLYDFNCLKPLFELEKQDFVKAIRVIDKVFIELDPLTPISPNTNISNNNILPAEQYSQIFYQIYRMQKDIHNQNKKDKQAVLKYWEKIYPIQCYSLEYIAEKCLSNINRQKAE